MRKKSSVTIVRAMPGSTVKMTTAEVAVYNRVAGKAINSDRVMDRVGDLAAEAIKPLGLKSHHAILASLYHRGVFIKEGRKTRVVDVQPTSDAEASLQRRKTSGPKTKVNEPAPPPTLQASRPLAEYLTDFRPSSGRDTTFELLCQLIAHVEGKVTVKRQEFERSLIPALSELTRLRTQCDQVMEQLQAAHLSISPLVSGLLQVGPAEPVTPSAETTPPKRPKGWTGQDWVRIKQILLVILEERRKTRSVLSADQLAKSLSISRWALEEAARKLAADGKLPDFYRPMLKLFKGRRGKKDLTFTEEQISRVFDQSPAKVKKKSRQSKGRHSPKLDYQSAATQLAAFIESGFSKDLPPSAAHLEQQFGWSKATLGRVLAHAEAHKLLPTWYVKLRDGYRARFKKAKKK